MKLRAIIPPLILLSILSLQAEQPKFQPEEAVKKESWHAVEDNEVVIEGPPTWKLTIGNDRLVYVVRNKGDQRLRVPEMNIIVYNRYGMALAKYQTDTLSISAEGVRADKDYERFYPLDMILKNSAIVLPEDWGEATWLEMLPVEED